MDLIESFFFAVAPNKPNYKCQHEHSYKNYSACTKHSANIEV